MTKRSRSRLSSFCVALCAALAACESPTPPGRGSVVDAYIAGGRTLEAVRESERMVRAQPRDAELRLIAARANVAQGDLDRALVHLEMAAELDPSSGEAVIQIGEIEQRRQRIDDAYIAFRRAISIAPNDLRSWKGMALTAEALGFEAEAEKAYARWAELEKEQGQTGNTD
jgi:tetratricopeptide (TPR) repeat protein